MTAPRGLELEVDSLASGGTIIRVHGELDMGSISDFEAALERGLESGDVVVDLTDCDFLDSSAIRVLLAGSTRSESAGRALSLVAPPRGVRRALEIAGVDERLTIHSTLEATGD